MKSKSNNNFSKTKSRKTALISIAEASAISGLSAAFIRKLVKNNKIKHFRNREAKSRIFVFRADFEKFLGIE